MIYTGLNNTGEVEAIYGHLNGTKEEISEVYGSIGYNNPIFYSRKTLTGTSPLSYKALSKPLSDYLISGNTVQNGTPAPDAPVDVVGCGVRTGNLVDVFATDTANGYIENAMLTKTGSLYTPSFNIVSEYFPIKAGETYTYSIDREYTADAQAICFYTRDKQYISGEAYQKRTVLTVVAPSNAAYIRVTFTRKRDNPELYITTTMLNNGDTALPYEPYGWKIPLTVNGTEYPIYLGQVETTRRIKKLVFNGTEGWQVYAYASNTYRLSITQSIGDPAICSHFANSPISAITSGKFTVGSMWIYIRYADVADLADFKSYLADEYAAGHPVTVWYVLAEPETAVVNEPLHKIGDYADTISFAQAGVTIPTVAGANTLTIDTTVQPSAVSITGNIKPTGYGQLLDVNDVDIQDSTGEPIYIHG